MAHSDERPFQCDFCELKFKQRSHMKGHMRSFHSHMMGGAGGEAATGQKVHTEDEMGEPPVESKSECE